MSTSVTKVNKEHFQKTQLTFIGLTAFVILFDRVYALFSHGVSSYAMNLSFLYPFLGGFIFYTAVRALTHEIRQVKGYRLAYNLYNAGLAYLLVASLLQGILEIAGTASGYIIYLYGLGLGMLGLGLGVMGWCFYRSSMAKDFLRGERKTID